MFEDLDSLIFNIIKTYLFIPELSRNKLILQRTLLKCNIASSFLTSQKDAYTAFLIEINILNMSKAYVALEGIRSSLVNLR